MTREYDFLKKMCDSHIESTQNLIHLFLLSRKELTKDELVSVSKLIYSSLKDLHLVLWIKGDLFECFPLEGIPSSKEEIEVTAKLAMNFYKEMEGQTDDTIYGTLLNIFGHQLTKDITDEDLLTKSVREKMQIPYEFLLTMLFNAYCSAEVKCQEMDSTGKKQENEE